MSRSTHCAHIPCIPCLYSLVSLIFTLSTIDSLQSLPKFVLWHVWKLLNSAPIEFEYLFFLSIEIIVFFTLSASVSIEGDDTFWDVSQLGEFVVRTKQNFTNSGQTLFFVLLCLCCRWFSVPFWKTNSFTFSTSRFTSSLSPQLTRLSCDCDLLLLMMMMMKCLDSLVNLKRLSIQVLSPPSIGDILPFNIQFVFWFDFSSFSLSRLLSLFLFWLCDCSFV